MTLQLKDLQPPFFVCDLAHLAGRYEALLGAFHQCFERVSIGVSYKTNYLPRMLLELHRLGGWAEVVSMPEFELARRLDVPGQRIIFNGPNKRPEQVAAALAAGAMLNLDSVEEVDAVCDYARKGAEGIEVGMRVSIGERQGVMLEGGSRFGMTIDVIETQCRRLKEAGVAVAGLHGHMSTRDRGLEKFAARARIVGEAALRIGLGDLKYLDIGGGFGYAPPEMTAFKFPSFNQYAQAMQQALYQLDPALCRMQTFIEPGISLVCDAYSYYAPVTAVKPLMGRNLAVVDGSVQNLKPSRHRHNLPTQALDGRYQPKAGPSLVYDVAGYTCIEDDYIAEQLELPALQAGDILRIGNVGAYTLVMNPPFIRPAQAVYVLLPDGSYELAMREKTLDDWLEACVGWSGMHRSQDV